MNKPIILLAVLAMAGCATRSALDSRQPPKTVRAAIVGGDVVDAPSKEQREPIDTTTSAVIVAGFHWDQPLTALTNNTKSAVLDAAHYDNVMRLLSPCLTNLSPHGWYPGVPDRTLLLASSGIRVVYGGSMGNEIGVRSIDGTTTRGFFKSGALLYCLKEAEGVQQGLQWDKQLEENEKRQVAKIRTISESLFGDEGEGILTTGDYQYKLQDGAATITRYIGPGGDVTVPATLGGYRVTGMDQFAWDGITKVTSITIPASVTSLDRRAFYCCYGLTNVVLPASVTNIGWGAFMSGQSLASIRVHPDNPVFSERGGVVFDKSGSTLLFYPMGKRGDYVIPESVTNIGDWSFEGSDFLTNVVFGSRVSRIGNHAFMNCTELTDVTLPQTVTCIGTQAFHCCHGLRSFVVPDAVTRLEWDTFNYCMALESVVIGTNVCSIGREVFAKCKALRSVYFKGDAPSLQEGVFNDTNATIYYLPNAVGWDTTLWGTTFGGRPVAIWNPETNNTTNAQSK